MKKAKVNGQYVELTLNPITGNQEFMFYAKLKSVSPKITGTTPSGKDFRAGTIEYVTAQGEMVKRSCLINEANYQYGMEEGETYMVKASIDPEQGVLLVCSHLTEIGDRATLNDFDLDFEAEFRQMEQKERKEEKQLAVEETTEINEEL